MQLEIKVEIDAETNEYWGFNLFDLNVIFVRYHKEYKPKGKRKWQIVSFWDKYQRQSYNMISEPNLPPEIKERALNEITAKIKVRTWDEWKLN